LNESGSPADHTSIGHRRLRDKSPADHSFFNIIKIINQSQPRVGIVRTRRPGLFQRHADRNEPRSATAKLWSLSRSRRSRHSLCGSHAPGRSSESAHHLVRAQCTEDGGNVSRRWAAIMTATGPFRTAAMADFSLKESAVTRLAGFESVGRESISRVTPDPRIARTINSP
jgi:hypothetical protein